MRERERGRETLRGWEKQLVYGYCGPFIHTHSICIPISCQIGETMWMWDLQEDLNLAHHWELIKTQSRSLPEQMHTGWRLYTHSLCSHSEPGKLHVFHSISISKYPTKRNKANATNTLNYALSLHRNLRSYNAEFYYQPLIWGQGSEAAASTGKPQLPSLCPGTCSTSFGGISRSWQASQETQYFQCVLVLSITPFQVSLSLPTWALKCLPQQNNGVHSALFSTPSKDSKTGQVLWIAVWCIGTNASKNLFPHHRR